MLFQRLASKKGNPTMPFPEDTEMTMVSVITSFYMDMPDWLHVEVKEKVRVEVTEIRERELKHAEEIIEKAKRDMSARFAKITGLTRTGDPAQEIIAVANYLKSDIIAVGSRGIRGAKGMLGSVSRNILGHSECSVLIGK
jgi:nucleotide-binding universal stress UspA family protein